MHSVIRSLSSGILGVACALGTTVSFATAQLPVDQIVARNAAARGGVDAWRKVSTLSVSGQMDANKPLSTRPDYHPPMTDAKRAAAPGAKAVPVDDPNKVVELPYRLEMKRPLKTRLEIDFDGKTAIQVFDGVQGAKIRPFLGRSNAEPYTPTELKLAAAEQELDGPLIDHERKGTKVEADGIEKVNGADAYKLKLTFKNGSVRHLWVDAKTYLEVKMDGNRHLDGKDHLIETYFKNFQAVNGLMLPMLNETVIQGVPGSSKLTVAGVVVNPALDDSRFAADLKAPTVLAQKGVSKP
jgi:hypothetical protein